MANHHRYASNYDINHCTDQDILVPQQQIYNTNLRASPHFNHHMQSAFDITQRNLDKIVQLGRQNRNPRNNNRASWNSTSVVQQRADSIHEHGPTITRGYQSRRSLEPLVQQKVSVNKKSTSPRRQKDKFQLRLDKLESIQSNLIIDEALQSIRSMNYHNKKTAHLMPPQQSMRQYQEQYVSRKVQNQAIHSNRFDQAKSSIIQKMNDQQNQQKSQHQFMVNMKKNNNFENETDYLDINSSPRLSQFKNSQTRFNELQNSNMKLAERRSLSNPRTQLSMENLNQLATSDLRKSQIINIQSTAQHHVHADYDKLNYQDNDYWTTKPSLPSVYSKGRNKNNNGGGSSSPTMAALSMKDRFQNKLSALIPKNQESELQKMISLLPKRTLTMKKSSSRMVVISNFVSQPKKKNKKKASLDVDKSKSESRSTGPRKIDIAEYRRMTLYQIEQQKNPRKAFTDKTLGEFHDERHRSNLAIQEKIQQQKTHINMGQFSYQQLIESKIKQAEESLKLSNQNILLKLMTRSGATSKSKDLAARQSPTNKIAAAIYARREQDDKNKMDVKQKLQRKAEIDNQSRRMNRSLKKSQQNFFQKYKNRNPLFKEESDLFKYDQGIMFEPAAQINQEAKKQLFKPYDMGHEVKLPDCLLVKNQELQLYAYILTDNMVQALAQKIREEDDPDKMINNLVLDNNGLKDHHLAIILQAIIDCNSDSSNDLKCLTYSNNELGPQSVELICQILQERYPNHLEELRISNTGLSQAIAEQLFNTLAQNVSLQKLKLTHVNLGECRYQLNNLFSFFHTTYKLVDLDISWTGLNIRQFHDFWTNIHTNHSIQKLNISYNNLHDSQQEDNKDNSLIDQIIKMMGHFIQHNQSLIHLDLSGLSLGRQISQLIEPIKHSISLQAIHLSNNQIPDETLTDLELAFGFEVQSAEDEMHERQKNKRFVTSDIKSCRKIIGSQEELSRQNFQQKKDQQQTMAQQKLRLQTENFGGIGRGSFEQDSFIMTRVLGHSEMNPPFQETKTFEKWKLNMFQECWICQKWKYVLFFYDRTAHYQSHIKDKIGRYFMLNLNHSLSMYDMRRVAPTIQSSCNNWQNSIMSPMLPFSVRIDKDIAHRLSKFSNHMHIPEISLKIAQLMDQCVQMKFGIELKQHILTNLTYPDDSLILNLPKKNITYSMEMEDDQMYLWAGFVKPGKHTIVVNDPLVGKLTQSILVGTRNQEIIVAPRLHTMNIENIHQEQMELSVFSTWVRDTPQILEECLTSDLFYMVIEKKVKNRVELAKVISIFEANYNTLNKIHVFLSSHNFYYPLIDIEWFLNFCDKASLYKHNFQKEQAESLFKKLNQGQPIDRPTLLEAFIQIVRVIHNIPFKELTYQDTKNLQNQNFNKKEEPEVQSEDEDEDGSVLIDGLNQLFKDCLNRVASKYLELQEFRTKFLWQPETNELISANLQSLRIVYQRYSRMEYLTSVFEVNDALKMIRDVRRIALDFDKTVWELSTVQIRTCWGMSKMTVQDFYQQKSKYNHMIFVEFIEFICRISFIVEFRKSTSKDNFSGGSMKENRNSLDSAQAYQQQSSRLLFTSAQTQHESVSSLCSRLKRILNYICETKNQDKNPELIEIQNKMNRRLAFERKKTLSKSGQELMMMVQNSNFEQLNSGQISKELSSKISTINFEEEAAENKTDK